MQNKMRESHTLHGSSLPQDWSKSAKPMWSSLKGPVKSMTVKSGLPHSQVCRGGGTGAYTTLYWGTENTIRCLKTEPPTDKLYSWTGMFHFPNKFALSIPIKIQRG